MAQARTMADRLRAAGVDHRLHVLPGTRHALGFRADAWQPTADFLARFLVDPATDTPAGGTSGASGPPVSPALAGAAAAVMALPVGRRMAGLGRQETRGSRRRARRVRWRAPWCTASRCESGAVRSSGWAHCDRDTAFGRPGSQAPAAASRPPRPLKRQR